VKADECVRDMVGATQVENQSLSVNIKYNAANVKILLFKFTRHTAAP